MILKPATETPLTAFAVAQIIIDAGVPPGVVNVLTTNKASPICQRHPDDPRVRKVSFTGSTQVGRILLKEAADQVISSAMELGGNAPFVVLDDANISDALDGAMVAKMRNGGEACTAANRFYAHRSVYKAFTTALSSACPRSSWAKAPIRESTLGPMVNEKAVIKIAELVDDAVTKGGKLLMGGQRLNRPGYYYPPTLLDGVGRRLRHPFHRDHRPVAPRRCGISPTRPTRSAAANATSSAGRSPTSTRATCAVGCASEALDAGHDRAQPRPGLRPAAPFSGVEQSRPSAVEGADEGAASSTRPDCIATDW